MRKTISRPKSPFLVPVLSSAWSLSYEVWSSGRPLMSERRQCSLAIRNRHSADQLAAVRKADRGERKAAGSYPSDLLSPEQPVWPDKQDDHQSHIANDRGESCAENVVIRDQIDACG